MLDCKNLIICAEAHSICMSFKYSDRGGREEGLQFAVEEFAENDCENTSYTSKRRLADIHQHSEYSDGRRNIYEGFKEARKNNVWLNSLTEHGNFVDEDKNYSSIFRDHLEKQGIPIGNLTRSEMREYRFEDIKRTVNDIEGAVLLRDADPRKVDEDLEKLRDIASRGYVDSNDVLNYTMVVPHGIEHDYNIPIETVEDAAAKQDVVDSYERAIIDFLDRTEELGIGYDYLLAANHDVNTPFDPQYVKMDENFADLSHEEKLWVWDKYFEKFDYMMDSLAPKLEDKGIVLVGAHPTLAERDDELMEAARKEDRDYREQIAEDELDWFIYDQSHLVEKDISSDEIIDIISESEGSNIEIDEFVSDQDIAEIYPEEFLRQYYEPIAEKAAETDNFVFEINGKGVERQWPHSVFWKMMDKYTFGSDAHRVGEQTTRSRRFSNLDLPGEFTTILNMWLELEEQKEVLEPEEIKEDDVTEESSTEPPMVIPKIDRKPFLALHSQPFYIG